MQNHPTKKRTLGISTISLGKFSRSCQAMPRKSHQNNNVWGLFKWKSGGESTENDSEVSRNRYPQIYEFISRDIYVDDCISGSNSENEMLNLVDKLEIVLNSGGFSLKGIAFLSKDPESISDDGVSIHVAEMKWYTKDDLLAFDFTDMNFSKRIKGRKVHQKGIPAILTRRHCVSKVAEIYHLVRKTPLTASLKIDLHELMKRNLQWDDAIPDNLRPQWISNFEMLNEIKTLTFKRAIFSDNAVNLEIQTSGFGDASKEMASVAVYTRFQRKNGMCPSQLLFCSVKNNSRISISTQS